MKSIRPKGSVSPAVSNELSEVRARLVEAEETLRAIRSGEVDALVVTGKKGDQIFTLQGAEHAYRVLIESMNEGALTLSDDMTILYANDCFARMVKHPLEKVVGSSIYRFFSVEDQSALGPLLRRATKSGAKIQVRLNAGEGALLYAQISIRSLVKDSSDRATTGIVVTDLTDVRRGEEMLRALARRVVEVQEAERARVALELHDNITQLLCAVIFRSSVLAENLSAQDEPAKTEAINLCTLLGQTVEEVERISRKLRPSVLDQMGLVAVMRSTSTEFAERTGVSVKLSCVPLTTRLPVDTELALYRILQQALSNVETHARAHHVVVTLALLGPFVRLKIKDDGLGFDVDQPAAGGKRKDGLGLLSMRERASYVGGTFTIKSVRRAGTEIEVRIPVEANVTAIS